MFNVGGGEMFAILLLALLVLGPERLPKAMGQVGRYVAQLRRMSDGFQDEIRRAMNPDDAPFRPGEESHPTPAKEEIKVVHAIDTTADETEPTAAGDADGEGDDEVEEDTGPGQATGTDGLLP